MTTSGPETSWKILWSCYGQLRLPIKKPNESQEQWWKGGIRMVGCSDERTYTIPDENPGTTAHRSSYQKNKDISSDKKAQHAPAISPKRDHCLNLRQKGFTNEE
jgi:hypothetical protein